MAKLFERTIDNNPSDLNLRFAFGRAGVAAKNMTFTGFINWITAKLTPTFLKSVNNLSDVANPATALQNLGGASVTAVNNALGNKENVLAYTEYQDCTILASPLVMPKFTCKVSRYGRIVSGTGTIQISQTSEYPLFSLPSNMPVPPVDIYFSACDADGGKSKNLEFKIEANTLNVYLFDLSIDRLCSFNFIYIA